MNLSLSVLQARWTFPQEISQLQIISDAWMINKEKGKKTTFFFLLRTEVCVNLKTLGFLASELREKIRDFYITAQFTSFFTISSTRSIILVLEYMHAVLHTHLLFPFLLAAFVCILIKHSR